MFEVIGIITLSLIAAWVIFLCVGLPWLSLGFGGPSITNWIVMLAGLAVGFVVAYSWWHFVGTNIHVRFG